MNVFINGVSSKVGGGKNILDNYINDLLTKETKNIYYFLTPEAEEYLKYEAQHIKIVDVPNWIKKGTLFFILYFIFLPKILKKYDIDVIINFADIVIPSRVKQIYFFDWPYAVFNEKYIWEKMLMKDKIIRKTKVFLIKKYISKTCVVLCQTETIKKRLLQRYKIKRILIQHTPISFPKKNNIVNLKINEEKTKLFYPANDSTHKNHHFIVRLVRRIHDLKLPYLIITTLESDVFNKIYGNLSTSAQSHVLNLGRIKLEDMPSVYNNIDYLFFPSLLETYGIPYIEAMYFGKPILASDLDFARDLCGNSALYFDPFKPDTVIDHLKILENNLELQSTIRYAGKEKLKEIPTWSEIIEKYENLIENI